jgi:hypothetical protein
MSENERQVYAELLANTDALDALYTEYVGKIITPALTADDKAREIRAAVNRERETARDAAQEALL